MTAAQQRALDEHWGRWGLEHGAGVADLAAVFGRRAPRILEIGFGMGDSLAEMAAGAPDVDFIGVEVHRPGVGRLLHTMAERDIHNIRIYCHDAVEVLRDCIAPGALDGAQIFFPDPWHKKRHHKRRLVQASFVALLAGRLAPGASLHLATDWEPYAEQMMAVLGASTDFRNAVGPGQYAPRPETRPPTKFERRGERLGHGVRDLLFVRR